jgi:predicted HAD superfamily Cof-like phosphohydrolase
MLKQVQQFQNVFDPEQVELNQDTLQFRADLIEEELNELRAAKTPVETLDAVLDIIYLAIGTAVKFGLSDKLERAFQLVHENNMSKRQPDGSVLRNDTGKVMKPEGFKPVDLSVLFGKKAKEWFERYPCPIIRERLLGNLQYNSEWYEISYAISEGFYWDKTKEGHYFWQEIFDELCDNNHYPTYAELAHLDRSNTQ